MTESKGGRDELGREAGQNIQGVSSLVMGSGLYPARNGVLLKVFKQWPDRPGLCFERETPYLTDWVGGWAVGGRQIQVDFILKLL